MGLLDSLAARVKGVGDAIQRGVEQFEEAGVLRMHQRRLGEALKKPRTEPAPIRGELTPSGFTQKGGGWPLYPFVIAAILFTLLVLWLLRIAFAGFGQPGWSAGQGGAVLLMMAVFGSFIGLLAWNAGMKGLGPLLIRGELTVERWPIRPGEQCAVRYRARARGHRAIVRARAMLRCVEEVQWRDKSEGRDDGRSHTVHSSGLGDTAPVAGADGWVSADWKMQIPAGAPPTLDGKMTAIGWQVVVDVQAGGAVSATQEFTVLVVPVTA